jgi:uncharacterized protein
MAGSIFSAIIKNCDTSHPRLLLSFGLSSLLLLGCAQPVKSDSKLTMPTPSKPHIESDLSPQEPNTMVSANLAQFLPVGATATIAGHKVNLEVTRTIPEQAKGLMYRPALPDDRGMLFNFIPPRPVAFWMKNVPVSLDMVFMLSGKVVAIANSAPPCKTEPCPVYPSEGVVVDSVIELRSGWVKDKGLKVGDRITVTLKK